MPIVLLDEIVIVLPDNPVPESFSRYIRKSVLPFVTLVLSFQKIDGVFEDFPFVTLIFIPEQVYVVPAVKALVEFALDGAGKTGESAARPASVVNVNVTSVPHAFPTHTERSNTLITSALRNRCKGQVRRDEEALATQVRGNSWLFCRKSLLIAHIQSIKFSLTNKFFIMQYIYYYPVTGSWLSL